MVPQWLIEKKRDGHRLEASEIHDFIAAYTCGDIPDYQTAALAMAIYFQGMDFDEVTALTEAMMQSGDLLDHGDLEWPTADKHSTGGIGDKVSLALAPLCAACGVAVPMISGRGLGITGGTLDKLESIPGYRTDIPIPEFKRILAACGCSIIGQTANLAPADRKFYALRDVTGTVPSIPLISASIMCKKLAEGAKSLVLDVKCGSGAFMKTQEQAAELARTMTAIGAGLGRNMTAVLTDMNQPLGATAGNALEVIEAIDILMGRAPSDVTTVTLTLCHHMLLLAGAAPSLDMAKEMIQNAIDTGDGVRSLEQMIEAHGGDPGIVQAPDRLPQADHIEPLLAPRDGFLAHVDADSIGRGVLLLGAGRTRTDSPIDHAVGISKLLDHGSLVSKGDPLLLIHSNDTSGTEEARHFLDQAFTFSESAPPALDLIKEIITPDHADQ